MRKCPWYIITTHLFTAVTFAMPWTVARQAPLPMGFLRQEYWSGSPFPSPGASQPRDPTHVSCLAGRFFTTDPPGKPVLNKTTTTTITPQSREDTSLSSSLVVPEVPQF